MGRTYSTHREKLNSCRGFVGKPEGKKENLDIGGRILKRILEEKDGVA
jgi:hypothetical protein